MIPYLANENDPLLDLTAIAWLYTFGSEVTGTRWPPLNYRRLQVLLVTMSRLPVCVNLVTLDSLVRPKMTLAGPRGSPSRSRWAPVASVVDTVVILGCRALVISGIVTWWVFVSETIVLHRLKQGLSITMLVFGLISVSIVVVTVLDVLAVMIIVLVVLIRRLQNWLRRLSTVVCRLGKLRVGGHRLFKFLWTVCLVIRWIRGGLLALGNFRLRPTVLSCVVSVDTLLKTACLRECTSDIN